MAGEAVLGAAVQVLLQNLLEYSFGEIKRAFGCKKEITKLQSSLDMVQKFMSDAEKKEINGEAIKCWLQQLEDVAFEADAVLDEFNYKLLRKKVKNQNQVLNIFPSGSINFNFRRKMAHKIEDLNEKLEKINKDAVSYGLQMAVASALPAANTVRQVKTDSFSEELNFVGRGNDVEKIVEGLLSAPPNEKLFVVPIFGMGGAGKTTLARKVFNHEKIKAHFGETIWLCVPIDFEAEYIFKLMLESLTGESVQGFLAKQTILEKIQKVLKKKRYLLVLDDIWSEEWEDFMGSLFGISSEKGNGIVLTTRKGVVATKLKSSDAHQLDKLSVDDCWSIIKAKALPGLNDLQEFEETGRRIAQRCGGLPLAAKVIGAFLRGKTKDQWLSILNSQSLSFGHNENPVTKILRLSYDNLPSASLKKCFAYCSVLPPHYVINKDQMISLWIAEGFLQGDQSNDMEAVGDQRNDIEAVGDRYFEHLLQNSLFQDVKRDDFGNIMNCSMHSFVHDLACSISRTRSIHEGNSQSIDMQHVRYLGRLSGDTNCPSKEQAKFLRTFIFSGEIAHKFLGFNYLHTLTLSHPDLEELPFEMEKLIHLRFLDIRCTFIRYMPDSICKLFNLQTLYAPEYLREFPSRFTDLICLRHLVFPPRVKLPPEIGRLTSLQTLEHYRVGNEKGCRIVELGKLENLKGKLYIQNLERVNDKVEAEHAYLFGKRNVYSLSLLWNEAREGETNDENVLEGLQPHPHLKALDIHGYEGNNFPLWTMRMEVRQGIESCGIMLKCVISIKLVNCRRCEEIPTLGHLPHLKFLELNNLPNVRSIGLSFYANENSSNTSAMSSYTNFPALEQLKLLDMPNLKNWVDPDGEATVFSCLSYMEIKSCQQLKSVPCHFPCLEELYLEKLNEDFPLSNVCGSTSSLRKLDISELTGLIHLPEGLFVKNEKLLHLQINGCPSLTCLVPSLLGGGASLKRLEVKGCENLSELPDDINTLQSLERLTIKSCPKLKSIPCVKGESRLTSLRQLEISECQELRNLPSELLESCASTLSSLQLIRLENLETASVISCLPRLSCLTDLTLCHLPKLVTFPTEVISRIRNLRDLFIGGYSEAIDQESFTDNVKCILQGLHHLERLGLVGKDDWDSLLVDTQHLTNLKILLLFEFGIEALPEWIRNIISLQQLYIRDCKRLKYMPSKEALTNVCFLVIDKCPLMKESFTGSDDSERDKISHIELVLIDGLPFTKHLPNGGWSPSSRRTVIRNRISTGQVL